MRGELSRLRGVEEDAKNKANQVSSLLEELEKLKKELRVTQQEKKTIEDWAQKYRDEMEKVRQTKAEGVCACFLILRLSGTVFNSTTVCLFLAFFILCFSPETVADKYAINSNLRWYAA